MNIQERGAWRTSSYTGSTGNCVEVAPGRVWLVRDTKQRDAGYIVVPQAA